MGGAWQAIRFVLAFALVLAAAAGGSRWLARQARGGSSAGVRLVGGVSLGGGRSVCAVHVGRRVLVLGVADHQVRLLQTITDADEVEAMVGAAAGPPVATAFARALATSWARRGIRSADEGDHVAQ